MPTPAAPAQPPQVKLDTTADSRGNFNNFLKNMNGATLVNPPVVAPAMGAMTPNMAPAANIDIFNQPIAMMQNGGDPMDASFSDFAGFDDPSDPFGGGDTSDPSIGDTDISLTPDEIAGGTFDDGDSGVSFADDSAGGVDIVTGGQPITTIDSGGTTIANRNVKFNDLNQNQINEIKSQIDNRNMVALSEEDEFFKDGNLTAAGEAELNKRNAADLQLVAAGQVLPSEYLSTISDIFGTGEKEKSVMDAVDLTIPVADAFDITKFDVTRTPVFQDQIQRQALGIGIKPELTQTALDPFVSFDVGNQARDIQRALEQGTLAENLDKAPTTFAGPPEITQGQRVQELLDRGAAAQKIKDRENRVQELLGLGQLAERDKMVREMDAIDRETAGRASDKFAPTIFDADKIMEREERFGTLPTKTLVDIERLSNVPIGQRRAGKGDDPTFFQGLGLPSIFDGIERFSRDRMAAKLAGGNVPEKNIVRNDSGLVIGIKDNFGNLVEGIDPNQQLGGDDSGPDPIIRPLTPKPEEPKPELPPNVIGGTALAETPQLPTVVESPFTASTVGSTPVTFDVGDLNRLIEQLTGVAARPVVSAKKGGLIGMANGGLIKAVDDFLAAS
jgi:hypothetical protein